MEKNSSKVLPVKHIRVAANESLQYIQDRKDGKIKSLSTPWEKYNTVSMGGIEWNTIHTIAGMSGAGKTAILNELETALFDLNPTEEFDVLSFNFEMLARNLVTRKLSKKLSLTTQELNSGIPGYKLHDDFFAKAVEEAKSFVDYPIYYVDVPGSVLEIKNTINQYKKKDRGLIVLLDHTILVKGKKGDEMERTIIVDLYTMFNALKKESKISFIILSQLNRGIESPQRLSEPSQHFPKKADLFASDASFQFSDVVMVSINPEQLGLEAYGPKHYPVNGRLYWHWLKVREGTPCIAMMENKLKYNMIIDYVNNK